MLNIGNSTMSQLFGTVLWSVNVTGMLWGRMRGGRTTQSKEILVHLGCTNLQADVAPEGFYAGVDVTVLLETRRWGEGLATLVTGVRASPYVWCSDVTLEVTAVCEDGTAVLTVVLATVGGYVSGETLLAAVAAWTLLAAELVAGMVVVQYQVLV